MKRVDCETYTVHRVWLSCGHHITVDGWKCKEVMDCPQCDSDCNEHVEACVLRGPHRTHRNKAGEEITRIYIE